MGRRGPKPQSLVRSAVNGNPSHRPPASTPGAVGGAPEPSADLSAAEAVAWRMIVGELAAHGLLGGADRVALECYCAVYVRWREAEVKLKEKGPVYATDKGNLAYSPWLSVVNKCIDQLARERARFGLDPSSRAALHAPPPERPDPLDDFLAGPS